MALEKSWLTSFLVIYSVIKFKRTDDILQGISKLDYYVKVSVFQVYKDNEKERIKSEIFSSENIKSIREEKSGSSYSSGKFSKLADDVVVTERSDMFYSRMNTANWKLTEYSRDGSRGKVSKSDNLSCFQGENHFSS